MTSSSLDCLYADRPGQVRLLRGWLCLQATLRLLPASAGKGFVVIVPRRLTGAEKRKGLTWQHVSFFITNGKATVTNSERTGSHNVCMVLVWLLKPGGSRLFAFKRTSRGHGTLRRRVKERWRTSVRREP